MFMDNPMAKTLDYYDNNRKEVAKYIPSEIKSILDVGCGQGAFLQLIKEKTSAKTWGIEMEPEMAEIAKKHTDTVLIGKVEDVIGSLPDRYFDCISFNDVLEHLLAPADILQLIKPKFSNNGILVASIPNVRYFGNLYELIVKKDWEYKDAGILDATHLRFFTKKSMKRMLELAGYKIVLQVGVNPITDLRFKLFNTLTLGTVNDTKYLQYVCIASPI